MAKSRDSNTPETPSFLKRHIVPISLAIVVTFIGLFGSDVTLWLRFDRNAILSGEIWRLFTGHLAHLTWSHLFMNLLGLLLVWGLFNRNLSTKRWTQAIFLCALGISLFLLIIDSHLRWYVGLSGVLHGMFVLGCMYDLRSGRWDAKLLIVLIIAKLLYEQLMGPLPGSVATAGGGVVVDAHLFGAIMGFITYRVFLKIDGPPNPFSN